MIGDKLYKQGLDLSEYEKTAIWCNKNNATLVDKGEYFEVIPISEDLKEQTPSLPERIAVLEDAVNTLMEGVDTNG